MRISGIWWNSDFFKLWSSTTISQMGTQVSFIALPLIAVIFLRATPFEVSVLNAIDFLPSVLFGLPVGVWVDRHRRRPIMIITDIIRGFGLLMIPISAGLHLMSIWQLYIVVFIIGAFSVPFDVAYQSFLPSLVEKNDLVKGNAALELSQSGSSIAGPSVAGLLISHFTAPIGIIADSISYFGSAVLLFIRTPNDHMASNKDFSRARFFIKTKE